MSNVRTHSAVAAWCTRLPRPSVSVGRAPRSSKSWMMPACCWRACS